MVGLMTGTGTGPNQISVMKPDYLAATASWIGTKKVRIAGREVEIRRPNLGRFVKTLALLSYPGEEEIFTIISEATGMKEEELDSFPAWGLALLWVESQKSLTYLFTLPFMQSPSGSTPGGKPLADPWDYDGRWVVRLIHELAKSYHWSKKDIESLYPEEAFCFMQEIIIDQHRDREWEYTLSDVGIDKSGHKQPFPPIPWGKPIPDRVSVSARSMGGALGGGGTKKSPPMSIVGEVIDLEKLYKDTRSKNEEKEKSQKS